MLNLPRYRNQSLADVLHLIVEPPTRDRIAIARMDGEGQIEATAGTAIWARRGCSRSRSRVTPGPVATLTG